MIRNVCTQVYIMCCRNPGGLLSEFNTGAPPQSPIPCPFIYDFWQKRDRPFRIPSIEKWYLSNLPTYQE